jgi:hypothetical protein
MVVAQLAVSLVLLAAGGLVVRSFERLLRVDPGFRPEGVLSFWVRMPPEFFPRIADVLALQDRIEEELAALPGVTGASATSVLPLCPRPLQAFAAARTYQMPVRFPGAPGNTGDADRDTPLVDRIGARNTYLDVMGIRLLAGRPLDRPPRRRRSPDRQCAGETVLSHGQPAWRGSTDRGPSPHDRGHGAAGASVRHPSG